MDKKQLDRVIKRFTKDYNVPVNIYEPEIFEYYTNLYDFFPKEAFSQLLNKIENEFEGNVDAWLDYCSNVRENAINAVKGRSDYAEAIALKRPILENKVGEHSCYNHENNNKRFISLDLKKANFQAVKSMGLIEEDSYEDFIKHAGGDDYIVNSKYLRQVIFGNLNPSSQVNKEKELINDAYNYVHDLLTLDSEGNKIGDIFSFSSDEIIIKLNDDFNDFDYLAKQIETAEKNILDGLKINVRIELFEIKDLNIENYKGDPVDAYVRKNLISGEQKLKKASTTFYPQIYKIWKGMEIEDNDLLFYFEGQVCTFKHKLVEGRAPLKIVNE